MEDTARAKRAKKERSDHSALKAALAGKSALESLEVDQEEDVFNYVDEDQYAEIVESRRNGVDFVVDDEGLGYYDDGEEHVGVGLDAHEAKKRLKEIADDTDKKLAKKARKLMDAGAAQRNALLPFVRTGAGVLRESVAVASTVEALDIDSLLDVDKPKAPTGKSKLYHAPEVSTKPIALGPTYSTNSRIVAPRPMFSSTSMPIPSLGSYGNVFGHDDSFDPGAGGYEDTAPVEYAATDGVLESSRVEEKAAHIKEEPEPVVEQKLNLSKTTKKLNVAAFAPKPASPGITTTDPTFKPTMVSMQADSLGLSAIGSGSQNMSQDSTGSTSLSQLDPQQWLLKTEAGVDEDGDPIGQEEYVNMFWIDACETNGIIYLFGKVPITEEGSTGTSKRFISCCVAVHGAERNLFVLPRATGGLKPDGTAVRADFGEVYQDLNRLLVPDIIPRSQGQAFRCKPVKRSYAFELGDIPREETSYLKVVYSARHGVPSAAQCQQRGSIEHIFGSTSSPLELFLLKRKLMGPCWITIKHPRTMPEAVSWCKLEIGVENPKFISRITLDESPQLVCMSVSMKTALNPATHVHEIISISGLIHTKVDPDADTELRPQFMKRFTFIRQLGLSCGSNYPPAFPHDLQPELARIGSGVLIAFPNERALLSAFFARMQTEDPDILASHNLFGFEFDVLLARTVANKLPTWSKIGRLRRTKPPRGINDRDVSAGRILCDTYKAAKEFLRETTYSLSHLSLTQLKCERGEVDPIDVPKYFFNTNDLLSLLHHTSTDAMLVLRLLLKLQVVPLTKQLTNLSGNLWSRTVRGARAERIEYLLLHEFHTLKYILPERKAFEEKTKSHSKGGSGGGAEEEDDDNNAKVGGISRTRAKAAYAGGLVLEPKKGLYDTYILLLDFNSLYPSLIQEYNLCFTTIPWTKYMPDSKSAAVTGSSTKIVAKGKKEGTDDDDVDDAEDDGEGEDEGTKALPPLPDSSLSQGVLPRVIKTLVDRRKSVKGMLKGERDPIVRQQLDIRQKALKLTANSMYGCLGFAFSRFYARPIAALVTSMGREALQRTVDQATNQFGLEVIYGDTDSVMINTNSVDLANVKTIGNLVKREVNKLYKSLELDIDGIFKSMLLLKKKKYAALSIKEEADGSVSYEREMKGLDLVRRDWCPLSKDAGRFVVEQILSGNPRDEIVHSIHEFLTNLAQRVRSGEEDASRFVVTKGLNKSPKDYPDCNGQAHLQVALQMLKANKSVNIGDHIPYLICTQGPKEGAEATMRAYHPDDVLRSNGALTIDYEWYLNNQILPPISRLCEPIDGTSTLELSKCLGLETAHLQRSRGGGDDEFDDSWGFTARCQMEDSERFRDCVKLTCKCLSCSKESEMPGVYNEYGTTGLTCNECGAMYYGRLRPADCYAYISNRVSLLVRQSVRRYYDCWLVCDDPTCKRRTMQQSVAGLNCTEDCHGRMVQEYDEAALHNQLKYIETLFDVERKKKQLESSSATNPGSTIGVLPDDHVEIHRLLHQHMRNTIIGSAYNWVRPSLWASVFERVLTK